jgi:hypothetical protein
MIGLEKPKRNILDLLLNEDLKGWDRWNCTILAPKNLGNSPIVTVRLENKDGSFKDIKLDIKRPEKRGHLHLLKMTAEKRN